MLVALLAAPTARAAFPGSNGKIAFAPNRDGNYEIYSMNPDGTGQTRLTNTAENESDPAWSPDGQKIAFSSGGIDVMNADGTGLVEVAASGHSPAWSPDGQKIAFVRSNSIWVMNAGGGGETQLTEPGSELDCDSDPAWSPRGDEIAFSRLDAFCDAPPEVYKMKADGTDERRLATAGFPESAFHTEPDWAPKAPRIAFTGDPGEDGESCFCFAIFKVNSDGTNPISPFPDSFDEYHPAWSPDGAKIAHVSTAGGDTEIAASPSTGGSASPLTNNAAQDTMPAWQSVPTPDDLALTMTDAPDPVPYLHTLTYSIQVRNWTNLPASGATVTDTLPAGVTFDSATASQGSCTNSSGTVTCNLGTLAGLAVATVEIRVTVRTFDTLTNSASVSSNQPDPDPSDNSAQVTTAVTPGYARPQGATPVSVALALAFKRCSPAGVNREHGPGLAHPSCNPPLPNSDYLTVGTLDSNGNPSRMGGNVSLRVVCDPPAPNAIPPCRDPGDQADVRISTTVTDVRHNFGALDEYTGELELVLSLGITDKANSPNPATDPFADNATVLGEVPISAGVPCSATPDNPAGSTCAVVTHLNSVVPGAVVEGKRANWELGAIRVNDGGADGAAATPDNTLFATQGIFVP